MIKRYIILLTALVALQITMSAQTKVGVELSPQFSNRFSYRVGVNVDLPLSVNALFSPGLFYSTRHRKSVSIMDSYTYTSEGKEEMTDIDKATNDIHAHYLTVPLRFGYKAAGQSGNEFRVLFGPYLAYFLDGCQTTTVELNGTTVYEKESPTHPSTISKKWDYGLCVELQYLWRNHYKIGLNIEHGLTSIYRRTTVVSGKDPLIRHVLNPGVRFNQTAGLTFGYIF